MSSTAASDIRTSVRTRSGTRWLTDAGVLLAQLGVVASAGVIWFFAGLTFFGEPLHPADYLHMTAAFSLAAAGNLLSLISAVVLRCRPWVLGTGLALALACGAGAVAAYVASRGAPPGEGGEVWWWPFQLFVWLPSSWPMILMLLLTPFWVRGRSRLVPPRPRDP
jgi:hypothetical protein